ncbi:MAG: hypothetical protein KDJ55_02555 [Rhodobiaceae bacterium]|nr:hypothetical protein [Rhodobiaceae bacterium]MCC0012105.1 hypothetical protein [Rhodobiaceae bacterium]MCC0060979.1 hypothetical protein [Rhodobiaceae bacterium]
MNKLIAAAFAALSAAVLVSGHAMAGSHTLNCVDETKGLAVTVTVEASSRAAAIEKVSNDPSYSDYDQCK